ncbi:MAG: pirin family protein [Candidatus Sericytochromatia bacterium]|nr:pirin family protein [Candidatus Sericytochromatia bacterium]
MNPAPPARSPLRPVVRVVRAPRVTEGGGFVVRRPVPANGLETLDPILMIDEMGPVTYGPGEAVGAPDHPHRGFETVTYVLEGEVEHADSAGHAGTLGPGDVQWMTAGAGVVHREMPSRRIQAEGGRMHGFQVWVNLPAALKSARPRYQELRADRLARVTLADGMARGRIIAGEAEGAEAPVRTHVPVTLQHWTLDAEASIVLSVPRHHTLGLYVFRGEAQVGDRRIGDGELGVLGEGEAVALVATVDADVLLVGGKPIGEPVAWAGPFVMNHRDEVLAAYDDYIEGRMGQIPPEIIRA